MKEFKVKKGINKVPLLWGMTIPLFVIFLIVIAVSLFTLTTGVSMGKIIGIAIITTVTYFVCTFLSKFNLVGYFFKSKLPDSIKIDKL